MRPTIRGLGTLVPACGVSSTIRRRTTLHRRRRAPPPSARCRPPACWRNLMSVVERPLPSHGRRPAGALLLAAVLAGATAGAADLPSGFTETRLAGGLSNPTAMAFAPDGRLFVCEQGG